MRRIIQCFMVMVLDDRHSMGNRLKQVPIGGTLINLQRNLQIPQIYASEDLILVELTNEFQCGTHALSLIRNPRRRNPHLEGELGKMRKILSIFIKAIF